MFKPQQPQSVDDNGTEMRVRDLPRLSEEEEKELWDIVGGNVQTSFTHIYPNDPLNNPYGIFKHPIFKISIGYVVCGQELGRGNWTRACMGLVYTNELTVKLRQVVVKIPSPSTMNKLNIFGRSAKESLIIEAGIMQKFYGYGEVIEVEQPMAPPTFISIIPFLGEMTLRMLLQRPELCSEICIDEWLRLFNYVQLQLRAFHDITQFIHGDIKAENLVVSLAKRRGKWIFTMINLIDFGNAGTGIDFNIGDVRYQPLEAYIPGLRTKSIDYYAIGLMFLEVIKAIESNARDEYHRNAQDPKDQKLTEKQALQACKDLFNTLTTGVLNVGRAAIDSVIQDFLNIKSQFNPSTILSWGSEIDLLQGRSESIESRSTGNSPVICMNADTLHAGAGRLLTVDRQGYIPRAADDTSPAGSQEAVFTDLSGSAPLSKCVDIQVPFDEEGHVRDARVLIDQHSKPIIIKNRLSPRERVSSSLSPRSAISPAGTPPSGTSPLQLGVFGMFTSFIRRHSNESVPASPKGLREPASPTPLSSLSDSDDVSPVTPMNCDELRPPQTKKS